MKKMFLVGAGVACLAFMGCQSNDKDVSMTETSDCSSCSKSTECTEKASPAVVGEKSCSGKTECSEKASPAVIGEEKSHCEEQTGECPFTKSEN